MVSKYLFALILESTVYNFVPCSELDWKLISSSDSESHYFQNACVEKIVRELSQTFKTRKEAEEAKEAEEKKPYPFNALILESTVYNFVPCSELDTKAR